MAASRFRIAIVGAGPGGLTLGNLLHKQGLPFTIFELRPRPTDAEFEKPAGSLDLHEGSGLAAIRELGLFDKFKTLTGDCTQAVRIADKHGAVLFAEADEGLSAGGEERPEIARNKLTRLLLSQISPSAIHWQHKLASAKHAGNRQIQLGFAGSSGNGDGEGLAQTFDLVVGADGAWSKVRSLLTDTKPSYAGQQSITASVCNVSTRYPHLASLIGNGTFMALGEGHGIIAQRAANDTARLYTLIKTADENFATTHGLHSKTAAQAKSILFDGETAPLRGFGPVLKELVTVACDDETAAAAAGEAGTPATVETRPMHTLCTAPASGTLRWETKPGVTLLGDAAHLMPPNGEGVTLAMRDALELSKLIAKAHHVAAEDGRPIREAMEPLIKEYESDMFKRADQVAEETEQLLAMMYGSDDGAGEMVKFFDSIHSGGH